jgi:serine/threonine protein kinase
MGSSPIFAPGTRISSFEIRKHIGKGGYSDIYWGVDIETRRDVAIKIEFLDSAKHGILDEGRVLRAIQNSSYFPKLFDDGVTEDFRYLAISLMGASLLTIRKALPNRRYTLHTALHLALEMINGIEAFHGLGFIHRDIKPSNFLLCSNSHQPVCLIDFGLSRSYVVDGSHIERSRNAGFIGTAKYASVHAHDEKQLSRRDDLISWFYSVVEMAQGSLPWPGSRNNEETIRCKEMLKASELCTNLPPGFRRIWKYLKQMQFDQKPNYAMIRMHIRVALKRMVVEDRHWDWERLDDSVTADLSPVQLPVWEDFDDIEDGRELSTEDCCCSAA